MYGYRYDLVGQALGGAVLPYRSPFAPQVPWRPYVDPFPPLPIPQRPQGVPATSPPAPSNVRYVNLYGETPTVTMWAELNNPRSRAKAEIRRGSPVEIFPDQTDVEVRGGPGRPPRCAAEPCSRYVRARSGAATGWMLLNELGLQPQTSGYDRFGHEEMSMWRYDQFGQLVSPFRTLPGGAVVSPVTVPPAAAPFRPLPRGATQPLPDLGKAVCITREGCPTFAEDTTPEPRRVQWGDGVTIHDRRNVGGESRLYVSLYSWDMPGMPGEGPAEFWIRERDFGRITTRPFRTLPRRFPVTGQYYDRSGQLASPFRTLPLPGEIFAPAAGPFRPLPRGALRLGPHPPSTWGNRFATARVASPSRLGVLVYTRPTEDAPLVPGAGSISTGASNGSLVAVLETQVREASRQLSAREWWLVITQAGYYGFALAHDEQGRPNFIPTGNRPLPVSFQGPR